MATSIKKFIAAPLAIMSAASLHGKKTDLPNIIFILADDMGYGELSCYNHLSKVRTANIDRLAEEGIMMTQAYASPVSSPTRSCFLTGRFPQNIGVYGNHDGTVPGIGPLRNCFVEDIHDKGYRTGWFGKWHQGWDVSNHPANNGFDTAYGFLGGMHDYQNPSEGDHYVGGPFAKNCYVFDGFRPVDKMNYLTEELTSRAIDFIDKSTSKDPFFIYLAYNAPHTPLQAPEEVVRQYIEKGLDAVMATRCAMVDVLDKEIGRLLNFLEETGRRKNTMIVFMSDNGAENESDNGGLRGTKMTAWEGGIRVPMIASWPGRIPYGTISNSICSIVDLPATFLSCAANDIDLAYGDGISLLPYFSGEKSGNAHEQLVFSIHLNGAAGTDPTPDKMDLFAVRDGAWKIVFDKKRGIDALYNLEDDPGEKSDLSDSFPERKNNLYEYGRRFLGKASPACGKIRAIDTRKDGDRIKIDSLKTKYSYAIHDEN